MEIVNVYPLYKRRALVTRESAGTLRNVIHEVGGESSVALDLTGIRAITPSFIDQVLLMVEERLGRDSDRLDVLFLNPPPGMASKLRPIGRAHNLSVAQDSKGNWVIRGASSNRGTRSIADG